MDDETITIPLVLQNVFLFGLAYNISSWSFPVWLPQTFSNKWQWKL